MRVTFDLTTNPHKDDYDHVANVHCLDLGQTFQFTNHIDKAWWEHLNVDMVKESRSTSVGDVVEDENGKLWLCASVGWEEVEWTTERVTIAMMEERMKAEMELEKATKDVLEELESLS